MERTACTRHGKATHAQQIIFTWYALRMTAKSVPDSSLNRSGWCAFAFCASKGSSLQIMDCEMLMPQWAG